MKKSLRRKFTNRKEQAPFDLSALRWCNNFRDFDKVVTAPLHSFSNFEEYYADSSSYRYISGVKTPSLVIHALDDPLIPPQAVPKLSEFSPYTVTDFTSHGGHLGFVGGSRLGAAEYWLEQRVIHFLRHFI
jgi:predicted alpha/beta-fold hydrolase